MTHDYTPEELRRLIYLRYCTETVMIFRVAALLYGDDDAARLAWISDQHRAQKAEKLALMQLDAPELLTVGAGVRARLDRLEALEREAVGDTDMLPFEEAA